MSSDGSVETLSVLALEGRGSYHSAAALLAVLCGVLMRPQGQFLCQYSVILTVGELFQNRSSYAHLALFLTVRGSPTKGAFSLVQGHSIKGRGDGEKQGSRPTTEIAQRMTVMERSKNILLGYTLNNDYVWKREQLRTISMCRNSPILKKR